MRVIAVMLALVIVSSVAFGADLQYKILQEQEVNDKQEVVKEKMLEVTILSDAIDEEGKAVKVKSGKFTMNNLTQFDARIANMELELAKWQAIRAEYNKK